MAADDRVSADAPGPWDVEAASDRRCDGRWLGRRCILRKGHTQCCQLEPETPDAYAELLDRLAEATALAEERLAGLDRLRAECEAWQTASAGWQARCSELEGLLGEALSR